MCTVTIVSSGMIDGHPGLLRLITNRDEQRTRPPALPPQQLLFNGRQAIMPIDPASGGTWVAVTDAGLVLCMLNVNPKHEPGSLHITSSSQSRGGIIPSLADATNLQSAAARASRIDLREFPPFKLLLLDRCRLVVAASDGAQLRIDEPVRITAPIMHTSSGLGDHLVEPPRREHFINVFSSARDPLATQQQLHQHRWPEAGHLSIAMSRADARTVSRTTIDLAPDHARLAYTALDDELSPIGSPAELQLAILLARVEGCVA